MSQCLEYAFDIDAEVEPIPETDHHYTMNAIDNDFGDNFDDLIQEDRATISLCKGLRRKTVIIEDLQPLDTTKSEYSYRPFDNINQFWAGPSYWKFRKSRKLTMIRETITSSEAVSIVPVATAKRRKANRKKNQPVKFTLLFDQSDNDFILVTSKKALKFKNSKIYIRWDTKKLKLPTDLQVDRNMFNHYTYCPSIPVSGLKPTKTTVISEMDLDDDYDFDQVDDNDMGGAGGFDANDVRILSLRLLPFPKKSHLICICFDFFYFQDLHLNHTNGAPVDMDHSGMDVAQMDSQSQTNHGVHEISQHFEGAPELVRTGSFCLDVHSNGISINFFYNIFFLFDEFRFKRSIFNLPVAPK